MILIIIIKVRKKKKKKRRRKKDGTHVAKFQHKEGENLMMIFESPHKSEPEQAFPSLSLDIFLILELPCIKKRSSFFSKKQLQNTLKRLSQTNSLISSLLKVTAQHAIEKEEKEHVLSLVLLKSYRSSPCYNLS